MPTHELEEFRYPSRKPWLLLIVLVVTAGVWWWRTRERPERPEPPPPLVVEPLDVATPAVPAAAPSRSAPAPAPTTRPAPVPAAPPVAVQAVVPPGQVLSEAAIRDLLVRARAAEANDDLESARDIYLRVLHSTNDRRVRDATEAVLGRIGIALITSARPMRDKQAVVVRSGDSLERLARRHGTTIDLIQTANGIVNPNRIRAGAPLQVFTGTFALTVSIARNDLVVALNGTFFKRYRVGTGLPGKTPLGTFRVVDKIKEPVWWPSGGREIPYGHPDNILGTRWMSIQAQPGTPRVQGYGIHGTWDDASIGRSESAGCVRMRNADVEELFMYIPAGVIVTIVE